MSLDDSRSDFDSLRPGDSTAQGEARDRKSTRLNSSHT